MATTMKRVMISANYKSALSDKEEEIMTLFFNNLITRKGILSQVGMVQGLF
jgi:hypothetical protein